MVDLAELADPWLIPLVVVFYRAVEVFLEVFMNPIIIFAPHNVKVIDPMLLLERVVLNLFLADGPAYLLGLECRSEWGVGRAEKWIWLALVQQQYLFMLFVTWLPKEFFVE